MRKLIIAIDGPSGAGKGTVARAVASELGYRHVDSGAMYRAIGWKALREGVALDDEAAVAALADASLIVVSNARVLIDSVDVTREIRTPEIDRAAAALADASLIVVSNARVLIDSVDVTREIRTPEIDRAAAAVARLPRVRAILVAVQRDLGAGGEIVMEGRDIGTVVFPQADVKIYLDAAPEERARRRAQDPSHSGGPAAVSEVKTLLTERDRSDTTRAVSPLYAAADAIVVDTTGKPVQDVVKEVLEIVKGSGLGARG